MIRMWYIFYCYVPHHSQDGWSSSDGKVSSSRLLEMVAVTTCSRYGHSLLEEARRDNQKLLVVAVVFSSNIYLPQGRDGTGTEE